jgi:CheY-like chemotaxis protein
VAPLRALIVDDNPSFVEAARRLLDREGIDVVGAASTSAAATELVERRQADVVLIDVELGHESGFDLARQLAAADFAPPSMIMISTHAAADVGELVAVTPALGFLGKSNLSAAAIRDLVEDRDHGHGCRHEALVYSSADELVTVATPFLRLGLAAEDNVLVVMREGGRDVIREALDGDASSVEFADASDWYRTLEGAFDGYSRYIRDQLDRGAQRIRIFAETLRPAAIAAWNAYEAKVSVALASEPVSFICAYDTRELPPDLVADAASTHPLLRSAAGVRPSPRYAEPEALARALG